ncbi:hypothetical protein [Microbacterium sp.]|uniref:hypothetical protein n=1 Tax=Microbacterium sp. TaxID=51671 RepID=UPI0039E642CD
MLQSHGTAERRADGEVTVVHLYERLLPYAVLFGMASDWARALELRYAAEGVAPVWFPGDGTVGWVGDDSGAFDSFDSAFVDFTHTIDGGGDGGGGFGGGDGGGGDGGGGDGGG